MNVLESKAWAKAFLTSMPQFAFPKKSLGIRAWLNTSGDRWSRRASELMSKVKKNAVKCEFRERMHIAYPW